MKLYTEEQVKKAIELARVNSFGDDFKRWISNSEPDIIAKLTCIELPSDDDINKEVSPLGTMFDIGFTEGVKWVIEQIIQQKDGTI